MGDEGPRRSETQQRDCGARLQDEGWGRGPTAGKPRLRKTDRDVPKTEAVAAVVDENCATVGRIVRPKTETGKDDGPTSDRMTKVRRRSEDGDHPD